MSGFPQRNIWRCSLIFSVQARHGATQYRYSTHSMFTYKGEIQNSTFSATSPDWVIVYTWRESVCRVEECEAVTRGLMPADHHEWPSQPRRAGLPVWPPTDWLTFMIFIIILYLVTMSSLTLLHWPGYDSLPRSVCEGGGVCGRSEEMISPRAPVSYLRPLGQITAHTYLGPPYICQKFITS